MTIFNGGIRVLKYQEATNVFLFDLYQKKFSVRQTFDLVLIKTQTGKSFNSTVYTYSIDW